MRSDPDDGFGFANHLGVGGVHDEHPGTHDVGQAGTGTGQRVSNDLEAAPGLDGRIIWARAVGPDRSGT